MIEHPLKSFLTAATLVLALPAAGLAQDRPTGCVIEAWPAYLDSGPLAGEYGKLFMFMLVYAGCERQVMVVGSYDYLIDIARQNGDIGPAERRYHIDMLVPEKHNVLEYRTSPPGYAEMREMALRVLNYPDLFMKLASFRVFALDRPALPGVDDAGTWSSPGGLVFGACRRLWPRVSRALGMYPAEHERDHRGVRAS